MKSQPTDNHAHRGIEGSLRTVALTARESLAADICVISLINPITRDFMSPLFISSDDEDQVYADLKPDQLSELTRKLLDQNSIFLEKLPTDRPELLKGIESLSALSLYTKQNKKPLAVLYMGYRRRREFNHEYRAALTTFGIKASPALQSMWRRRRYHEVARTGQKINEELKTQEILFDQLHAGIRDIVDTSYFFMLAIHNQETNSLDMHMVDRGHYRTKIGGPFEGFCAYVMNEGEHFISGDFENDSQSLPVDITHIEGGEGALPQSVVCVPLKLREESLGVLCVQHLEPNVFDQEDLQIMELLGNQVSLALNNVRLFSYLQTLDITAQELTQELNSERLLQDVADKIKEATRADVVILFPYLQTQDTFQGFRRSGDLIRPDFQRPPHFSRDDVARLVIGSQEPVFARDSRTLYKKLGGVPGSRGGNFEEREGIASTAAVPLRLSEKSVGALFVNFRKPQRFDEAQKNLIRSLASYAAIAIRNSREFDAIVLRQVEELKLLQRIDKEIGRTLNIDKLLSTILALATERVGAEAAAIMLYNPLTKELETKAAIGNNAPASLAQNIPVDASQGITVWSFNNRKSVRVGNVHTDPEWRSIYYPVSDEIMSEMDVPLIDREQTVGVINLESTTENRFSEADENIIETLAGHAVLAVKNAQLYERATLINEQLLLINEELSAIQQVGQEIVGQLKTQEVLDTILRKALELTRSKTGEIMLCDKERGDLNIATQRGMWREEKDKRQSRDSGVIGEAVRKKQLLNVNVCEPPYDEVYIRFVLDACLELAVPIMRKDEVIGVINIEGPADNPFTSKDEELITRLAVFASIALQNAEQFENAKSSGEKLMALYDLSKKIISQQGNSEDVMKDILKYASYRTEAEMGRLDLYSGGRIYKTYHSVKSDSGTYEISSLDSTSEGSNIVRGIAALVANTHSPYLTSGDAQDDPHFKGNPDVHSEIAVPILTETGELEGVLDLASPRLYAFNDEDTWVLQMFAQEAIIAIQHARNYSRAKEEAERFRLLWEAGRELSELTEPEDAETAKDIVIRKILDLTEGEVVLRRYDENIEAFVLECVKRPRRVPPPDRIGKYEGVSWQVAKERRTIVVHDVTKPEPGVSRPAVHDPDLRTLVITPILFEDRYYGNLVLRHDEVGYFEEADIKLLEGLAQQLAITIYRLKDAQARIDAEQNVKESEFFTELGQSAYEITHRIGNELGLVKHYIKKIREWLKGSGIESVPINEELDKVLQDVFNVLNMSKGLKKKVAGLGPGGRIASNPENYPVNSLLEYARRSLPPLPENITINWRVGEDLGNIYIVPEQILDILHTLVSNAIEALLDGGEITVRAYNEDRSLHVDMSDTGPGIPESDQPKIFNLFFSTKKSSGFGLWSARRYARANSGELTLESSSGRGTTFKLRLPLIHK